MDFTEEQLERYSRHIILKEVGVEGQSKLLQAKVLIIGAGGLGAPIALYLAAAGVGTIGIVDADVVDLSNLQRQVIHFTADVDRPKVESAANKMRAINPDVNVITHQLFAGAENILDLLAPYDFIVDGTDNFGTKFLVNDACVVAKKPYSHGGILRFTGQMMTILPGETACYRCVFREPPPPNSVPTCSQAGVLGAIAGMLGTMQATETLKFITGAGQLATNSLVSFNALNMDFRKVKLKRQANCPICGDHPVITHLEEAAMPLCDLKAKH
ncbi:MAG: adenylyltransferase [Candidatus Lambdaproteobacteria bacterium RIFOXYD1_FULL_56_27]|uniref:Molybdopterin-synthase adenylyltransferase n=1 Tax=Candidatus Lambdaproteobacteria bacterium RIFOXYD2_FULL_56_26 TaxID=1817773 RepID=A0A1F6H402_9PROT|nr:MAG: adenylyltransferase [Candidatus Lambdaproteobacteria bacterium RIFOXYD2_FULL_56_26]OGH05422.1 MAG: adenylyltransferase [Candidatus Lambdaproteobacteria bacterium RIFOXYC1_FULL_56_13]OGH09562.1 MAG: adenylyltransferase [Candidatus Lambdaproteobacteria bacterium RIFOXYD1_FULL_56_27]